MCYNFFLFAQLHIALERLIIATIYKLVNSKQFNNEHIRSTKYLFLSSGGQIRCESKASVQGLHSLQVKNRSSNLLYIMCRSHTWKLKTRIELGGEHKDQDSNLSSKVNNLVHKHIVGTNLPKFFVWKKKLIVLSVNLL